MSQKPHTNCPTCARVCDDAKEEAKRLNKKVFLMTIALTSALTLLGQEAAQQVLAYVKVVQDSTESGGGESAEANSSARAETGEDDLPAPRTQPFIPKPSTSAQNQSVDADEADGESLSGSVDMPLPTQRGRSNSLMDVVSGKLPSIGELVTTPSPIRNGTESDEGDSPSIYSDVISYSYQDNTVADSNARFVTDSPFGGYPTDFGSATIPAPAAVAVLGIVPLLRYRRR
jgi:hypothetical protein